MSTYRSNYSYTYDTSPAIAIWVIVLIVIGVILVVSTIIAVVCCFYRRRTYQGQVIGQSQANGKLVSEVLQYTCSSTRVFVYNETQKTTAGWIVPQILNPRPKMAKSIVYVITLITNRNHAFHCLN